jgi:hypothetical protein
MTPMRRFLLVLTGCLAFTLGAGADENVTVEGEGMADGTAPRARETALAEALRDAVRNGAGVDVSSMTKMANFELDYDQVLTRSFGYVREYAILHSGLDPDGLYRVRVRAEVAKGDPEISDAMAIQQIIRLKQSPKVALEVEETLHGLDGETGFARSWLEGAIRKMNLRLVNLDRVERQRDRQAAKDDLFGDGFMSRVRKAHLTQEADYIIRAEYHVVELAVDLSVIRPDTGEVLVSVPLPGTGKDTSDLQSPRLAARDLLHRKLEGKGDGNPDGYAVFRKLFALWTAELDLGRVVSCEFVTLHDAEYQKLLADLPKASGISAVWPGEFSSRGLSFIDVESRMDADGLRGQVLKILGDRFALRERNPHYLQFAPADTAAP